MTKKNPRTRTKSKRAKKAVSVLLTPEEIKALDAMCVDKELSRSKLVLQALRTYQWVDASAHQDERMLRAYYNYLITTPARALLAFKPQEKPE